MADCPIRLHHVGPRHGLYFAHASDNGACVATASGSSVAEAYRALKKLLRAKQNDYDWACAECDRKAK